MQRATLAKCRHQRIRITRRLTNHHRTNHHRLTRVLVEPGRHTFAKRMTNPRTPRAMPWRRCIIKHARRLKDRSHILISQPLGTIKLAGISRLRQSLEISCRFQHRSRHTHLSPALPQDLRAFMRPFKNPRLRPPKPLTTITVLQQAHTQIRSTRIRHQALKILLTLQPPRQHTRCDRRTQKPCQAAPPRPEPYAKQARRKNHRDRNPQHAINRKHTSHRHQGRRKQRPSPNAISQPGAHAGRFFLHDPCP